jgi:hypothetical protein
MAVTPPLDRIPTIPNKIMTLIVNQLNGLLDELDGTADQLQKNTIKLPEKCDCDDPRVQKAKDDLIRLNTTIQKVQSLLPYIGQVQTALQVVTTAAAAIKAAQLINPVTALPVIASELTEVQNTTISNAITSLDQLNSIPIKLQSKLDSLISNIANSILKLNSACNNAESFNLPAQIASEVSTELDNLSDSSGNGQYQDTAPSEFYNTSNVSDSDIDDRDELLTQLVDRQLDLLSSLQEAPSQVYQDTVPPENNIGKTGDYYIDTQNKVMYGPKPSRDDWGNGVNY